jgi:predicted glycosyltransferase
MDGMRRALDDVAGRAAGAGTGARFLFQVRNRRGLGHLMRGLNIARELRALDPAADILFYLRTPPAPGFWPDGVSYVVEADADRLASWPRILADFAPDVVVYDTMLPRDADAEPLATGARYAYIMRKCLPEEQREVFANPFLDRMAAIIVPHDEAEFGYPLPPALAGRASFVGCIVRAPERTAQAALRARYGVARGDFLLTSTVGGGGFEAQADAFFAAVAAAHETLARRLPRLRHVVVQGPHYGKRLAVPAGVTLVEVEPDMINLLAASDLVVAEGGYNTVSEIRVTGTPAVFMPSVRGKDDQEARVRELAARGLCHVVVPAEGAALAAAILDLHDRPGALAAIRAHYARTPFATGNRAAALRLRALVA